MGHRSAAYTPYNGYTVYRPAVDRVYTPPKVHDEVDPGQEEGDPAGPPLTQTRVVSYRVDEGVRGGNKCQSDQIKYIKEVGPSLK